MLTKQTRINFARYYNLKGSYFADNDMLEDALNCYSKAIELDPDFSTALFNRATIKADLGDLAGAKADFHLADKKESQKKSVKNTYQTNINFF